MQTNPSRSHTPPDQDILWLKPLQSQAQTTRDHPGVCQRYANYLVLNLFAHSPCLTHCCLGGRGEGLWLRHSLCSPASWLTLMALTTWPCTARCVPLLSGAASNELSFQQTIFFICWPYCTWMKPKSGSLFISFVYTFLSEGRVQAFNTHSPRGHCPPGGEELVFQATLGL